MLDKTAEDASQELFSFIIGDEHSYRNIVSSAVSKIKSGSYKKGSNFKSFLDVIDKGLKLYLKENSDLNASQFNELFCKKVKKELASRLELHYMYS